MNGALRVERLPLSLKRFIAEGLWGRLRIQASLSIGAYLRSRGTCNQGTPKDMLSKALEWASVSIWAPLLGNKEGRSFLRAFEMKRYIKR